MSTSFRVRPLALFIHFAIFASAAAAEPVPETVVEAAAETATPDFDAAPVPTVTVSAARDKGFIADHAASSTKSDATLFATPQAISVLTRAYLDARQVTSLNEAIQTTAGVASGGYGRRGWDDYTIRGQRASESLYVDGLKLGQSNYVAQEVFGVDSIEVVKGPASINFGQMQPGGIVNMISKRPRAQAFGEAGVTLGSYGYRQGSIDVGRPLGATGKAALRVAAMVSNADDATDRVWYKNRYLAPSLSLDLGARTDFTLLTAFNQRQYLRQQGIPVLASLLAAPGKEAPRSLFTSDPSVGPYNAIQRSVGYALQHRFDSGWTLHQNLRLLDLTLTGALANVTGPVQANGNIARNVLLQDIGERSAALDTYMARAFTLGTTTHTVMAGVDLNRDHARTWSQRCAIGALNVYAPVYGKAYSACATQTREKNELSYAAVYLRDQIAFNEQWSLQAAARHDRASTTLRLLTPGTATEQNSHATTGSLALRYQATPNLAPYLSYATSFLPVAGSDIAQTPFKPEQGRQAEFGAKFQSTDQRFGATVAYYRLNRTNVTVSDLNNTGYSVQVGAQRSEGFEAELVANLRNGWDLSAAFSTVDARTTEDSTRANIGKRIQNVPGRSSSLLANYQFDGALAGWRAGAGLRHESDKTSPAIAFAVPAYTVADASLSYQGRGYRVMVNAKNLFGKDYYAGVLSANIIAVGDPRTIMVKTVVDF